MAPFGDKDIGGLDVAMDDTLECAASSASAISMASARTASISSGPPASAALGSGPREIPWR